MEELYEKIANLKEVLNEKKVNIKDVKQWIAKGNDIHKEIEFESCLYCRNTINKEKFTF